MRLALITVAPFETVTGASFYHRRLLAAWREMGGEVEVVALDGPAPATLAGQFGDGVTVILEGAALEVARQAIPGLQARGALALIHHPTALEPGTPEARRLELKALERAVLPGFRRVLAASEPIAERLSTDFGVIRDHVRVLVPGTDHHRRRLFTPAPDGAACTILSLGTMIYRKGHDTLLAALAMLEDLDWRLILAGETRETDYEAQLVRLIERLGIGDRVERHGALTGSALEDAWERADLFALATRFEGFGMAIAEAMARGLPVAITEGGAAGRLVTPGAGVVAPVDDVVQLGKALRRLVFSTELRAEMGAIAWHHARNLPTWPDQARALREIVREREG